MHYAFHCPLVEKADENEASLEFVPEYSQLRTHSARTLTALSDVNTKLYIGTEVL